MKSSISDHHHFLPVYCLWEKIKKRSVFALVSILLFILLSYNGACIFSVHVSFPSIIQPVTTTFSPETVAGKSRNIKLLAFSKLYAVREDNSLVISKTHLPHLHKSHSYQLEKWPEPAGENASAAGESRKWVSPPSSTIMKPVQQENPPAIPPKSHGFTVLAENSLLYSQKKRRRNKQVFKNLRLGTQSINFAARNKQVFKNLRLGTHSNNFAARNKQVLKNLRLGTQSNNFAARNKQVFKNLRLGTQSNNFAARLEEFFGKNSSNSGCEVRFFMTWISSLDSFGDREFLSIETLFKSHTNGCLVILSNSMDSRGGMQVLKPFLDKGFKVTAISPDLNYLFKKTAAESWFDRLENGNVNPGEVPLGQNLSNLLRLSLLYKFGGIYIDTDVIVLKSFKNLRNAIGAQTMDQETKNWSRLNNAVMIFDKGHPLVYKFIEEFALTFDGNKWGHNGPYLVSRVVLRVREKPGFNFTILPPSAFYPVNWSRVRNLFRAPKDENDSKWLRSKLKQIKRESYSVHLWNKQSRGLKSQEGSIIRSIVSDSCIFCNISTSAL